MASINAEQGITSYLKPLGLTLVLYDPRSMLSLPLAIMGLLPVVIVHTLLTLIVALREIETALLLAGLMTQELLVIALKALIKQPRPFPSHAAMLPDYGSQRMIIEANQIGKYGMPSSHSAFMFFLVLCLPFTIRGNRMKPLHIMCMRIVLALVASLVAFSRVHFEYHTVTQVFAGALVGIVFGGIWNSWQQLVFMKRIYPMLNRFPLFQRLHFVSRHPSVERTSQNGCVEGTSQNASVEGTSQLASAERTSIEEEMRKQEKKE